MACCTYCQCERLGAPREPVEKGTVVICGGCAGVMIADVIEGEPGVRRPTRDESRAARQDPEIVAFLGAYLAEGIEHGQKSQLGKSKSYAPVTIFGPEHPDRPR